MQQLRYSTSAAAAHGLTRDAAAHAEQVVRQLRCGGDLLQPLADFLTAMRSPEAEAFAAAAVAAGAVEALEKVMRGEVGCCSGDEGAAQTLAASVMVRLMPHDGGTALARFITDKGAVIIGQGRGCGGAAALKPWQSTGHTSASVLAEGRCALSCAKQSHRDALCPVQLRGELQPCRMLCETSGTM